MSVLLANNARSTLAADVTDTDTEVTVQGGDASKFPEPTGGDWFPITIVKADATFEIMRCTGRAAAVLTVTRAQEGTTALAFATGDRIDLRLTAAAISAIQVDAANAACPPGMLAPFGMSSAPTGWLKANGAAISRTTYATLFAAIGTTFGPGNGSTTFNLPDLRGEFLRGWDDSRGVDAARVLGSSQTELLKSHAHTASTAAGGAHTHTGAADAGGGHTHTAASASDGAHTHTGTADSGGAHTHTGSTSSDGAHSHNVTYYAGGTGVPYVPGPGLLDGHALSVPYSTDAGGAHSHSVTIASGGAHTHSVSVASGGAHTHAITVDAAAAHTHNLTIEAAATHTHTVTVDAEGGAETRPRNVAALYCIKY